VGDLRRRVDRQGVELRTAQSQAASFTEERADWAIERQTLLSEISTARAAAAKPRPAAASRPTKKAANRQHITSEGELAEIALALDTKDPDAGVLSGWKPMAEVLRAAGHGLSTERAQRVLDLARRLKEETPDAQP
jgi:hypothetical protein